MALWLPQSRTMAYVPPQRHGYRRSQHGQRHAQHLTVPRAFSEVLQLIAIASSMKWSTTGQLLCNTPTMIIEGFILLVLIQAHNHSNEERGVEFNGILKRRLLLNSYVHSLADPEF